MDRLILRIFFDHGIDVLDCPARSSDFNPREDVWSISLLRVQANRTHFSDVAVVKDSFQETREDIEGSVLPNLFYSMPSRIKAAIRENCDFT